MPSYSISKRELNAWKLVFMDIKKWYPVNNNDNIADFAYGYNTKKALIQPFINTLGYFHDKLSFFKILNHSNHIDCIPKTYLSIDQFIKYRKNDNSLWFFKLSKYDCGNGVVPFFDEYTSVKNLIKNHINKNIKHNQRKDYIIQKGVENLLLYHNHKFDIRIHILITHYGDVYIYKNACMRISFKEFSNTCNCKKHQCTNGSLGANVQYTDKWSDWDDIYPSIRDSSKQIISTMKEYVYLEKGKFLLIGADFIIDKYKKAWILEFNTYPNLFYKQDPHMQPTITLMLKHMLHILTNPPDPLYKSPNDIYSWDFLMSFRK